MFGVSAADPGPSEGPDAPICIHLLIGKKDGVEITETGLTAIQELVAIGSGSLRP